MKEKENRFESLLSAVLTKDQIRVIREEIIAGARRLHRIVDENERARARRDEVIALLRRIDAFIEGREGDPFFLRTIYGAAKEQVKRLVTPLLEEILRETEAGADPAASAVSVPSEGKQRSEEEHRGGGQPRRPRRRRRPRRGGGGGGSSPVPQGDVETD